MSKDRVKECRIMRRPDRYQERLAPWRSRLDEFDPFRD
jgi:hypothetical protein